MHTENLNLTEMQNMEDFDEDVEVHRDEDSDSSGRSSRKGQKSKLPIVKQLYVGEKHISLCLHKKHI